jgi:hypothetical protein
MATAICIFSNIHIENALLLSIRLKIPILKELRENETILVMGSAVNPYHLLNFQFKHKVMYYIFQAENIASDFFDNKHYISLLRRNPVFHYSQYNADECYKRWGIKSCGLFDWEFLNRNNLYEICNQPIDLLFYGYPNETREKVEILLKEKYPDKNIVFAYAIYDDSVIDLITRAKYVLNIPYLENTSLETHRINQALACGCKVISKRSNCDYLNKKYESKIIFIDSWDEIDLSPTTCPSHCNNPSLLL